MGERTQHGSAGSRAGSGDDGYRDVLRLHRIPKPPTTTRFQAIRQARRYGVGPGHAGQKKHPARVQYIPWKSPRSFMGKKKSQARTKHVVHHIHRAHLHKHALAQQQAGLTLNTTIGDYRSGAHESSRKRQGRRVGGGAMTTTLTGSTISASGKAAGGYVSSSGNVVGGDMLPITGVSKRTKVRRSTSSAMPRPIYYVATDLVLNGGRSTLSQEQKGGERDEDDNDDDDDDENEEAVGEADRRVFSVLKLLVHDWLNELEDEKGDYNSYVPQKRYRLLFSLPRFLSQTSSFLHV